MLLKIVRYGLKVTPNLIAFHIIKALVSKTRCVAASDVERQALSQFKRFIFGKNEKNIGITLVNLQIKYRNNRLESDHGKLKQLINPARGFQSMKTAYAGIEIMRMFRKGQFNCCICSLL